MHSDAHYLFRVVPISNPPAPEKRGFVISLLEKNSTTEADPDLDSLFHCLEVGLRSVAVGVQQVSKTYGCIMVT